MFYKYKVFYNLKNPHIPNAVSSICLIVLIKRSPGRIVPRNDTIEIKNQTHKETIEHASKSKKTHILVCILANISPTSEYPHGLIKPPTLYKRLGLSIFTATDTAKRNKPADGGAHSEK